MTNEMTKKMTCDGPVRFSLGRVCATPGALDVVQPIELLTALSRHARGDWGDVPEADAKENELAVAEGFRILSTYRTESDERFWIITEADRTSTTVLLPSEY